MKDKIFFLTKEKGIWIDEDLKLLKRHYIVSNVFLQTNLIVWIKSLLQIRQCDLVYIWFGSMAMFPFVLWAKCLGKPVVIVAGGFDVARLDEIGHGAFSKPLIFRMVRRLLFQMANVVLCVSHSNQEELHKNVGRSFVQKSELVPLTCQPLLTLAEIAELAKRPFDVLMIASAFGNRVLVKGLDQFYELVHRNPHCTFAHVGSLDTHSDLYDKLLSCPNLTLFGELTYGSNEFKRVLNQTKIIVQLSRYESFCSSILEGAMCGAFPIVYNRFALPELIREVGHVVEFGNLGELSMLIHAHLEKPVYRPLQIADHFAGRYANPTREEQLVSIVEGLLRQQKTRLHKEALR